MRMKERILFGQDVRSGRYEPTGSPALYEFCDELTGDTFGMDDACASRHMLFLGGSGSGKTNAMNLLLAQARASRDASDTAFVVFDPKGDYYTHPGFFRPGDVVLGTGKAFRDVCATWNVFEEVLADGDDMRDVEDNAHEVAAALFSDRGSQTQPFFASAACSLFKHLILYLVRRSKEDPKRYEGQLNNAELRRLVIQADAKMLARLFSVYPDMKGLVSYFGDGSTAQGLGVLAELKSMVYDCFQGTFAHAPAAGDPGFSVRRFVRNKGGHALFVEYDLTRGHVLQPMYRLLLDLALKESMGIQVHGKTSLLLDELRLLPKLDHLDDALNFGRSKGVRVVAGLQSVEQMIAAYGEEQGKVVLGGFGSLVAMRVSDPYTCDYVCDRFGPNVVAYRYADWNGIPADRQRDGHVVEPWLIRSLAVGEAVVGLATQDCPFLFCFPLDEED